MVFTSTIQPMAVRPKNGITSEISMRNRMAFCGLPSLFTFANHEGRMSSSAIL